MKFAYRIVNVFARSGELFSGNPLCVFENGTGLDDATMQAVALQMNLSETTFIFPSESANARVRIFTPAMELPFAGHPTLGTAHVLRALRGTGDNVSLDLKAGVIPVSAQGNHWTLQAKAASGRQFDGSRLGELAAALGLPTNAFESAPRWSDVGVEQLMVPLASEELVRAVVPQSGLPSFTNALGRMFIYCFSPVSESRIVARCFFGKNAGSISEDPATGAACANLGGYLSAIGMAAPVHRQIHQGDMVGRPSILALDVDQQGAIRVGGEVIEFGGGSVDL